jgi:hypothetical protein
MRIRKSTADQVPPVQATTGAPIQGSQGRSICFHARPLAQSSFSINDRLSQHSSCGMEVAMAYSNGQHRTVTNSQPITQEPSSGSSRKLISIALNRLNSLVERWLLFPSIHTGVRCGRWSGGESLDPIPIECLFQVFPLPLHPSLKGKMWGF